MTGVDEPKAAAAVREAWQKHQVLWHRCEIFTGVDMTRTALRALGANVDQQVEDQLIEMLQNEILGHEVLALDGARNALERLMEAGVRRRPFATPGLLQAEWSESFWIAWAFSSYSR